MTHRERAKDFAGLLAKLTPNMTLLDEIETLLELNFDAVEMQTKNNVSLAIANLSSGHSEVQNG